MLNSGLADSLALLILGLVACFGYYQGFLSLVQSSRARLRNSTKRSAGVQAIALSLLYLVAAITASAVATLFYFSL
jgi:hypothetical protein